MDRNSSLNAVRSRKEPYDFCIIGGGATGLGTAVDAAARGFSVLLVERSDFAQGTSSRSTKLVHGGVRYLKQGNVSLVREALHERGLMRRNAPHLVRELSFVIPSYSQWDRLFYGTGMKVYDVLAGKLGLSPSKILSKSEVKRRLPAVAEQRLRGGVVYSDGQFDDARMAVNLAETAADLGAAVLNYVECVGLSLKNKGVSEVALKDVETGEILSAAAKTVVNATGVFVDELRRMEDPDCDAMVQPSQGVHLVLPKSFLPGTEALMVPKTADGRVLFAIPWHDCVVLGTTDTPVARIQQEPRALPEEIEFLMAHAKRYLDVPPERSDVLSVFAGLRPLVRPASVKKGGTAAISRDHTIAVGRNGMITVTGGKWTSYRKMAQDVIDKSLTFRGEPVPACPTTTLKIHGWTTKPASQPHLRYYGSDADAILSIGAPKRICEEFPLTENEVRWHVRAEMARTVEDVLARRSRCLLLGAKASIMAASRVAKIMAEELGRDAQWEQQQVSDYTSLANGYILR